MLTLSRRAAARRGTDRERFSVDKRRFREFDSCFSNARDLSRVERQQGGYESTWPRHQFRFTAEYSNSERSQTLSALFQPAIEVVLEVCCQQKDRTSPGGSAISNGYKGRTG